MHKLPAHLLTFRTYGTWLPGAPQGYTDLHHNAYGTPHLPANPALHAAARAALRTAPVVLRGPMRLLCLTSFAATCLHRGWWLHDMVAMPTHCHLVVSGLDEAPSDAVGRLKAYATRALRRAGLTAPDAPVWSRRGSTVWLFEPMAVAIATAYVARHRTRT